MNLSLTEMFAHMGFVAWFVLISLVVCSLYSLAVMIDRFTTFRAARKQSLEFLPALVKCLKDNQLERAVETSRKYKKSHIAKVVSAGLMEVLNQGAEKSTNYDVGAVQRSLDMSTALTAAEMKKGLGGLATIGSTAPFIG